MPSHAGSFLVASPKVIAPPFHQSVVLLLRHDTQGAFGLIVSQPGTDRKGLPFVVFSGGLCEAQGLLLLHGQPEWHEAFPGTVAAPGIFLGDFACLKKVTEAPEAGEPVSSKPNSPVVPGCSCRPMANCCSIHPSNNCGASYDRRNCLHRVETEIGLFDWSHFSRFVMRQPLRLGPSWRSYPTNHRLPKWRHFRRP
jgi:hypothetical protein